ncbi:hypothetical protein ACFV0C_38380 [Streptomyces sp. NPDC059568]|uniref:hypothetical protein n=1 Tax=unclassified Streptomyces TaxID=2593676 RepID=UPI0036AABA41
MSTLRVDVFACDMPCRQCSMPLRWVFGLLPSHRPDGSEFTTTDFPEAVDVARRILADPTGDTMDLAAQLHDRPPGSGGAASTRIRAAAAGTKPTGTFSTTSFTMPSTADGSARQKAGSRCRSGARSAVAGRESPGHREPPRPEYRVAEDNRPLSSTAV